jgi:hypothetical protein
MTAENPLTGLVPLATNLEILRTMLGTWRTTSMSPAADCAQDRSNHGGPDVPFCSAHRISYSTLSWCCRVGSCRAVRTRHAYFSGKVGKGLAGNSQGANDAVISTHMDMVVELLVL